MWRGFFLAKNRKKFEKNMKNGLTFYIARAIM
nr:MAG TPA: hypothetical protein [Caudoviricetes sp.]